MVIDLLWYKTKFLSLCKGKTASFGLPSGAYISVYRLQEKAYVLINILSHASKQA
jgi:hypothetical protein